MTLTHPACRVFPWARQAVVASFSSKEAAVSDNDMPQHQRHDDTQDMQGHRIQNAVDSTWLKVFARIVLPSALALIGFFLLRTLANVEDGQRQSAVVAAEQGRDLGQVKSDVRNITTRLDEGVIRQVNANTSRIEEHEKRLQLIERTVKTP